ncbi:hypothetical protein T4E_3255 [Trichinella pseudospiralis]|uniref:Uncharacterized protein n=1 Tax=Trichinella pseudospiralis TaxID=6337 RepID=A0A0V0XST4_TRIPS|nr:hypothetical protein T4E_3255 [Trichinella pseudospiralis]
MLFELGKYISERLTNAAVIGQRSTAAYSLDLKLHTYMKRNENPIPQQHIHPLVQVKEDTEF